MGGVKGYADIESDTPGGWMLWNSLPMKRITQHIQGPPFKFDAASCIESSV